MHILCAIHLTGAFDICLSRQRLLDEILYPLLTFSVTLDRLNDEAVRRATRFASKSGDARFELGRELD